MDEPIRIDFTPVAIRHEWQCRIIPPTADELAAYAKHERAMKRQELWHLFVVAVCLTIVVRGL